MPPADQGMGGSYPIMSPTQAPKNLNLQDKGLPQPLHSMQAPTAPAHIASRRLLLPSGSPRTPTTVRSDGSFSTREVDSGAVARAAAARTAQEAVANASPFIKLPGSTLTPPQTARPPTSKPQGSASASPLGARSNSRASLLLSGSTPPTHRPASSSVALSRRSCSIEDAFARWSVVPNTGAQQSLSGLSTPSNHSLRSDHNGAFHRSTSVGTSHSHRRHETKESWDVGHCLGALVEGEIYFLGPKVACSFNPESGHFQKLETRGRTPTITSGHTACVPSKSKRITVIGPSNPPPRNNSAQSKVLGWDPGGTEGGETLSAGEVTERTERRSHSHRFEEKDAFYVFDTSTSTWERHFAPGAGARAHFTATLVDNTRMYVVGGQPLSERDGGREVEELLCDVWILDVQTSEVSLPDMGGHVPPRRHSHGATAVGANIFVFGGQRMDEFVNKLSAVVRKEAETIGHPRDYARSVVAAVQELRREAAECLHDTTNLLLIPEIDLEKLVEEHTRADDTRERIALRRGQMLEATARRRQCALDDRERQMVAMCIAMIDDALDEARHLAVEELMCTLAESDGVEMPAKVIYCHRHGARKPTHGVDGNAMSPPGSPSPPFSQSGLVSRVSSVKRMANVSKSRGYAAMPPTSEKEDKWGTGVYTYQNQLLTHSQIALSKVCVISPGRGEDFLAPDEETEMTHMERVAKRLGLQGNHSPNSRFKLFTHCAQSIRGMPSRRNKVVAADVVLEWRRRCVELDTLLTDREKTEDEKDKNFESLKARASKLETENIRLVGAEKKASLAAKEAVEKVQESEKAALLSKERHQALVVKKWGVFMKRLSVRLWIRAVTNYLVSKHNPKELHDFQKQGEKKVTLKAVLKENDILKLKIAKAGEIKKEIALVGHQLEEVKTALSEVVQAVSAAQAGKLQDDMNEALLDVQTKVERMSEALKGQNLPEAGFAEHVSHRLATEKSKNKVAEQTIKNLTRQLQTSTNDRMALKLRADHFENNVCVEKGRVAEAVKTLSERDEVIAKLKQEVCRLEAKPMGPTDGALKDALKDRDDRVRALEKALADERKKGNELQAMLRRNEEERTDLQQAFIMVFERARQTSQGFEQWVSRFSGKEWYAWAQVQTRLSRDERDQSIKMLEQVRSPRKQ